MIDEYIRQLAEAAARARDKLALQMILHGLFPSAGWTIGCRYERDQYAMRYVCWPEPPRWWSCGSDEAEHA